MNNQKPLVAITGASRGIGRATALLFAEHGYPVLVMARSVKELEALPIEHKVVAQVDVMDIKQIEAAVAKAEALYGPVDLMINNAGIMPLNPYLAQSLEDKYSTLDVNIKGVINGMDVVLPGMVKRQHGTIMNISSIAGRYTYDNHSVYCGSKYAVNAITEQVRKEVAPANVRLTLIEPGIVDTNLLDLTKDKDVLDPYLAFKNAVDGGLRSEDVAQTILMTYELPQHVSVKELMLTHVKQAD